MKLYMFYIDFWIINKDSFYPFKKMRISILTWTSTDLFLIIRYLLHMFYLLHYIPINIYITFLYS